MTFTLASRARGCGAICADILAELPDWFGIPASNAAYADLAESGSVTLALDGDEPVGLMILKRHGYETLENYLLAVRLQRRHAGVGRALIAEADRTARLDGRRYLTVKTLGPSHPSQPYAETRAFYRAVGFTPLEEFTEIWGPQNPCLFMVRPVGVA